MSDLNDDFIQRMPLAELARFVADLSRRFGVTEKEMEQWRRMSHAERMRWLREMEEKLHRHHEGRGPDERRL